jgi:hypothetical protein
MAPLPGSRSINAVAALRVACTGTPTAATLKAKSGLRATDFGAGHAR